MKTLKFIGLFLVALLLVFMVKGMILGAVFFFYWLKLAVIAAAIAGAIYVYLKIKKQ